MIADTETYRRPQNGLVQIFVKFREAGIVLITVVLIALVGLRNPAFLTAANFQDILLNISILVIVALAQAMITITRGIDLSVSSMIGLTAMMVAFTLAAFPTLPPLLALLLGMALGAALGSLNGAITAFGGVPPIIVTLGTLSIYRGLIFLCSGSQATITPSELPPGFRLLSKGTPLGVPNLILFALV